MTTVSTTFEGTTDHRRSQVWSLRRAVPMATEDGLGLVGFAALCAIPLVVGLSAAVAGEHWYATLDKPAFAPPLWSFGVAWTASTAALAWSTWFVWRREDRGCEHERRSAFGVFGGRLVLGTLWAPLFFAAQAPDLGLLVLALQWLAVLGLITTYAPVSRRAAAVNVPHLLWVSYLVAFDVAVLVGN